ncbi:MAG: hypothetical protein FWD45_02680 [Coriobacteriia bacterium]|nr:hypothetical protein [Coriobacteriia bacterium]
MPILNKRDNWMRLMKGEIPEYIPAYAAWAASPPFMRGTRNPDGTGTSIFGVEQVIGSGIVPAAMPKTHDFILEDITKWREIVKVPDTSDVDWAMLANDAQNAHNPENPWGAGCGVGVFQTLVALMGFTEGLVACYEEPEEVKDMLNYITDWMVANAKQVLYHYKPEYGAYGDDIAHERNPFISLEMFRDIFAPCWRRYYEVFAEAGIPCTMHNCGHFEEFIDDVVNMGVWFWEPSQSTNDLLALKARYGTRLAICEGFELRFFDSAVTEEEVRALFRARMDEMAPGGAYCNFEFDPTGGGIPSFTPRQIEILSWTWDEFEKIRYSYYN